MDERVGEIEIRVRYAETDQMGVLHHANYFVYFEMGRVELLRSRGVSYRELEQQGYRLMIVRAQCRYHRPAFYDDLLRLRTRVLRAAGVRIEHRYELYRGEELLAEGETTLACIGPDGRPCRVPEIIAK
jgi:acyl-CoA thioester hydrolase